MAQTLTGGHTSSVLCVDLSTTNRVASGGENGELCLWSTSRDLLHTFVRDEKDCTSVLFSKKTPSTLYASFGDEILVFDTDGDMQIPVRSLCSNRDEINQIQLDDKEELLAACDDSGEIKVVNLVEWKVLKTLRHKHTNICSSVHFRPSHPWHLFSGGLDCKLIHWDFAKLKALNQLNMQELQSTPTDASGYMFNPPLIHHLDVSPNGKFLACALENGQIEVFDTSHRHIREVFSLFAHDQGASQVHFLDDSFLVSGGNDRHIVLWDLSKAGDYEQHESDSVTNGHSSPLESRNSILSELCKVSSIPHSHKVNWLKPFVQNGQSFVVVADQTNVVKLLPLN
ncbi:WD repeat-containing protein 53-like [Gigantopelta aegis]|uniref:WD repeat-containing protein 53-like n=1 Tax=Gigantopelta aegis TaxID=1735272 RepID=UPI001B88AC89|nr:WD repeat-containing protein 53-like [Gigantopelta aegis]XP_041378967.1 WD repeat-containing protein 53-like [Gigantopelta aegis]XP_041379013.1 WD repeat-containing protein 53-like [Gigantopelta aegis]